jgi:hypothetical protein
MQETQSAISSANKNGDDNAKYNSHHAGCSAGINAVTLWARSQQHD